MTDTRVTDEMLMAYADGELENGERERIARLAAGDPAIAARIARFGASRVAARNAFAADQMEPVPASLIAAVTGKPVAPTHPATSRWQQALWPVAACLALAVGAGGYWLGQAGMDNAPETLIAAATSEAALERLAGAPAGTPVTLEHSGGTMALVASATYAVPSGYCRQYRAASPAGEVEALACTGGDGWTTPVAVVAGGGDYRPASEPGLAMIDLYLDGIGAGGDIGESAEAELIARDWR